MGLFDRLFTAKSDPRAGLRPVYQAVVERARAPIWYHDGAPDTLDGRFDMVSALFVQLLLRLERSAGHEAQSALLTELFIDDMDGQLREIGIGDMIVGKHIGRMMAALGGRLGAYRKAGDDNALLAEALTRNLFRGEMPQDAETPQRIAARILRWRVALGRADAAALLTGELPPVPA